MFFIGADSQIRTGVVRRKRPTTSHIKTRSAREVASRSNRLPENKKRSKSFDLLLFGADSQIRTGDLILTKDALYLLSYISKTYAP